MIDSRVSDIAHASRRRWRSGALLVGAWLSFALVQTAVALAISRDGRGDWLAALRVHTAMALYWALVSAPIAVCHERLRRMARGPSFLVAAHLPLLGLVALGAALATRAAWHALAGEVSLAPLAATVTYYIDLYVASYTAIVAVAETRLTHRALVERQQFAARLESLLARARLDFLEAQLQPHFLFNALGAVAELAHEAPAAAGRVLRALIAIIRNALSTQAGEVTLGEELLAIEPYLDIQRMRFADWLTIDYDVDAAALDCLVPRFVLQPLVENAIRHGLTGRTAPGAISISAQLRDKLLILAVTDNGIGLRPSRGKGGYGIGLANLRERLTVLYGDREKLRLRSDSGAGTVAEVVLARRMRDVSQPLPSRTPASDTRSPVADDGVTTAPVISPVASPRRAVLATIGVWIMCGLLWTQQSFAYLAVRNRLGDSSWVSVARNDMGSALLWLGITPLVFVATRTWPIGRPRLAHRVVAYLCGGGLLALSHALLLQRVTNPASSFWMPLYPGTVIVDVAIVGVLVAIGHRKQLVEWLRERERTAAALSAEVRVTRARADRLRTISTRLVQALEHVSTVMRSDPQRTEELIARLGDYLRVAIECSDERGVTAEREEALRKYLLRFEERGAVLQSNPSA